MPKCQCCFCDDRLTAAAAAAVVKCGTSVCVCPRLGLKLKSKQSKQEKKKKSAYHFILYPSFLLVLLTNFFKHKHCLPKMIRTALHQNANNSPTKMDRLGAPLAVTLAHFYSSASSSSFDWIRILLLFLFLSTSCRRRRWLTQCTCII